MDLMQTSIIEETVRQKVENLATGSFVFEIDRISRECITSRPLIKKIMIKYRIIQKITHIAYIDT